MDRRTHPSVDGAPSAVAPAAGDGDKPGMGELREKIETGAYRVDPDLVAEAMLRRMSAVFVAAQPGDGDALPIEQHDA